MAPSAYWLTNVRLETGFHYDHDTVIGTETELFNVQIENGKIKQIISGNQPLETDLPQRNAQSYLMLPSFRDMHIHLDKTYFGGPWKAPTIPTEGLLTRLKEEEVLLPSLLPVAEERAKKLLDLLLSAGSTHIRTHCNIDPFIGLKNLEAVLKAKEAYKEKAVIEIVAFPQHGL